LYRVTTEVKVGLFVILATIVLIYMTFKLGEITIGKKQGYIVYSIFDSVAGLDLKSPVKMAGVEIGSVEGIELEEGRAKVRMRIFPGIKIRRGALAAIKTESLLGEKYIEMVQGKGAGYIKEGETIENTISAADFDRLIARLDEVAQDIKSITAFFRETVSAPENKKAVKEIIQNLREITENLKEVSKKSSRAIDEVVENIKGLTSNLQEMAQENRKPLHDTLKNLSELSENLKKQTPELIAKINKIADRLEKGEGTIGKLMKEEDVYKKLNSTLTGINKFVTATERFRLNVGFRGEYLFRDDETKGYFSLKLQPRKDKYYLLEVVDDPKGRVRVTDTTLTTTPPGTTVTTHEIKREDKLKFSAQFARKIGNIVLRGGLMEDTFGFGIDYTFKGKKLRTTFEAWNFDGEEDAPNPHLKISANYNIYKSIYLNAGVDDFINSKRSTPFLGAGLSFDDEDLKYILTRLPVSLP